MCQTQKNELPLFRTARIIKKDKEQSLKTMYAAFGVSALNQGTMVYADENGTLRTPVKTEPRMNKVDLSVTSSYLREVFQPKTLKRMVKKATKLTNCLEPDCLLVRGVSGISFGAMLSYETGIPLLIVRKPTENSHSGFRLEGYYGKKPLIVDDFISTGNTIREIINTYTSNAAYLQVAPPKHILLYKAEGTPKQIKSHADRWGQISSKEIEIYSLKHLILPKKKNETQN